MTKFADAVEINSSAMSSVSGGSRLIDLSHDATVGGIANVKELEELDSGGPTQGFYSTPAPNEYIADVHGGRNVTISESQFNADVNQVYQTSNVVYDSNSCDPSDPNNSTPGLANGGFMI